MGEESEDWTGESPVSVMSAKSGKPGLLLLYYYILVRDVGLNAEECVASFVMSEKPYLSTVIQRDTAAFSFSAQKNWWMLVLSAMSFTLLRSAKLYIFFIIVHLWRVADFRGIIIRNAKHYIFLLYIKIKINLCAVCLTCICWGSVLYGSTVHSHQAARPSEAKAAL